MRRTLRREELAQKVCSVPYAAKNWLKKCAAYPTPRRTDQNSVRRTLRRIELAQKVCGVPYAAHFFGVKVHSKASVKVFFRRALTISIAPTHHRGTEMRGA